MGSDDIFKKRKARRLLDRVEGSRGNERQAILIVVCGEKTEKNYFEAFKTINKLSNIKIIATSYTPERLVEKAVKLVEESNENNETYDQVWCVSDRDDFPENNIRKAFAIASKNNIRIAWSNQAFEFWYLLHFDYCKTAFSRCQYQKKLTEKMGEKYTKNSVFHYHLLQDKQITAIKNAKLLQKYHGTPFDPIGHDPVTNVHELVEILNQYIK